VCPDADVDALRPLLVAVVDAGLAAINLDIADRS
jgi:hypothetical protein